MAITVCGNCIDFGSQSICIDPAGIYVSGRFDFAGCGFTPTQAQGTVSGYHAGGRRSSYPGLQTSCNAIFKFPFASDTNATDGGELNQGKYGATGSSSLTHGYSAGGDREGNDPNLSPRCVACIEKFPFSSDTCATDIGDVFTVVAGHGYSGHSSSTDGYRVVSGNLEKFPFTSDTNSADVTEMVIDQTANYNTGISSRDAGYTNGGSPPIPTDLILKFPFANDTTNSDVAELTTGRNQATNTNSAENGYILSGLIPPTPAPTRFIDSIEKFSFASESPTSDISEVSRALISASGQSSTTDGYMSGGARDPNTPSSGTYIIQKHSFAADIGASCIGCLNINDSFRGSGHQV